MGGSIVGKERWRSQRKRKRLRFGVATTLVVVSSFGAVICLLSMPRASAFIHTTTQKPSRILDGNEMISSRPIDSRGFQKSRIFAASIGFADDGRQDMKTTLLFYRLEELHNEIVQCMRSLDFDGACTNIEQMQALRRDSNLNRDDREATGQLIEAAVQTVVGQAFATPITRNDRERVLSGVRAINLTLLSVEDSVPRAMLVSALNSLSRLIVRHRAEVSMQRKNSIVDVTFRMLQRLVTGVGVKEKHQRRELNEKELCTVLNAFCEVGRMDLASRVYKIQERTKHAPPVSAVTISILLKGYGRQRDLFNVEKTLDLVKRLDIAPDTVLLNSLMDAYVNCRAVGKAEEVFFEMQGRGSNKNARYTPSPVEPNTRSYNAVLKGYASEANLGEASKLTDEMKKNGLWDRITTNLLVHAAITAEELSEAAEILQKHTQRQTNPAKRHPNVEAYTELLDAYGKAGDVENAVKMISLMRKRGVEPNGYTYSCLLACFGRQGQIAEAKSTLAFMRDSGMDIRPVNYNSLISSLLEEKNSDVLPERVRESINFLKDMIQQKVSPDAITITAIVEGLASCKPSRAAEAQAFVEKLEADGVLTERDPRIITSLIKAHGRSRNLPMALSQFRTMKRPDLIAVNAFLDTCVRSNNLRLAKDTFSHFFGTGKALLPNVASYDILIGGLLAATNKANDASSRIQAMGLYRRMKREVSPDCCIIDTMLKPLLKLAQAGRINDTEVAFVAVILRDADQLVWDDGQLSARKRAVRTILKERLRNVLGDGAEQLVEDDELLRKHGWNLVDSGFRLWDGGPTLSNNKNDDRKPNDEVDSFLRAKGWNDVDSGFRIL